MELEFPRYVFKKDDLILKSYFSSIVNSKEQYDEMVSAGWNYDVNDAFKEAVSLEDDEVSPEELKEESKPLKKRK